MNWVILLFLVPVFSQQPPPSSPTDSAVASAPALAPSQPVVGSEPKLVDFDEFSIEELDDALEPTGPADVDNDVIQKLVDKFLNEGTLEEKKNEKVNKEAEKLINSSPYWDTDHVKEPSSIKDAKLISDWLSGYSEESEKILHQVAIAAWNYFTAASPLTKQFLDEAEDVARQFLKATAKQASQFDVSVVESDMERKQIDTVKQQGMNVLPADDLNTYNKILSMVNKVYTTSDVCEDKDQKMCIKKYSDLISTIQSTSSHEEALNIWRSWRAAVGANLTQTYSDLVKVTNQAAKLNGFEDAGQMWRAALDVKSGSGKPYKLTDNLEKVREQIKPLYAQLHAYFRRQVAAIYNGDANLQRDKCIPAHLLRSSTGDDWSALYEDTKPFEQNDELADEVMENLHKENVTARNMFMKAFKFMKYLGFPELPKTFWSGSVFARNWSKDMICQPATAYDMINGSDFRVKMCAQTVQSDFTTAHKLFAQLFYKYLSKDQPLLLRDAPSPSLSNAVAGAFASLAQNADYLKSQKLLASDYRPQQSNLINRLYQEALSNLVRIPFNLLADQWRYRVFEGKIDADSWSKAWWSMRDEYQGVSAPAGIEEAKYDPVVAAEISQQHAPASRHIVSYVAQFQILKALCGPNVTVLVGGPNEASVFQSEACVPDRNGADEVIKVMMQGASISWLEALRQITGKAELDATALLEYYEPLFDWLRRSNEQTNVYIGWDGPGEKFAADEVPEQRKGSGNERPAVPSDDQIAYPGQDCARGQECLLDSHCNGTTCICNDGMFTLQIADTYNCVPGNPANAGFTDGDGGLVIALNPNENKMGVGAPSSDPDAPDTEQSTQKPVSASALPQAALLLITMPLLALLLH